MIDAEAPLETVPLYVRAGAIIPIGPEMNYVGEKATDPVTFEIYPDSQAKAKVSLYEDDGVSPEYNNGIWRRTVVNYQSSQINVSAPAGSYQPGPRNFVFEVHPSLPGAAPVEFPDDGRAHYMQLR